MHRVTQPIPRRRFCGTAVSLKDGGVGLLYAPWTPAPADVVALNGRC